MMNALTDDEVHKGYRLLFDGKTLGGWDATIHSDGWIAENGSIVCVPKGDNYLYTLEQFEDFELQVDFMTEANVNSGIFFRWSDLKDPVNTGLEMQILDTYHKEVAGNKDCGAIYDLVAPNTNAVKPAGQWNHTEIKCKGGQIELTLNKVPIINMNIDQWTVAGKSPDGTGNKFVYAMSELPRLGHIGFQDHGGRAMFRNIKIRNI